MWSSAGGGREGYMCERECMCVCVRVDETLYKYTCYMHKKFQVDLHCTHSSYLYVYMYMYIYNVAYSYMWYIMCLLGFLQGREALWSIQVW